MNRELNSIYFDMNRVLNFYRRQASKAGKNYHQLFLFFILLSQDWITQSEIIDITGFPKQSVSRSIKQLNELGLLKFTTNPDDKRSQLISLNEAGTSFAEDYIQDTLEPDRRVSEQFPAEKLQQLSTLMRQLRITLVDDHT